MKIAINQLLGVSISSYRWPLNLSELIYDYIDEDLYYISTRDKKTKVSNKYVDMSEINSDFEYTDNYRNEIGDELAKSLDLSCLEKYGITIEWYEMRSPKYYNFEDDELLMEFEVSEWDRKTQYPDLIPYVQDYIDNVRVKSYDGYMSFEPDKLDEVDKTDYAYIYAILKKEDMLDNNKYRLEQTRDTIMENCLEYIGKVRYKYNGRKYRLDYENKRLLLLNQ